MSELAAAALKSGPTPGPDAGPGPGLAVVETAIRTGMIHLGAGLLEGLLATQTGHCGQWIECGAGHRACFVGYRDKALDTVLGPIRLRRAWYHCIECRRGVIPRDDQLEVARMSLSPGLRTMIDTAAAAAPFAKAADLLSELAGLALDTKRVERAAEGDGLAAAAAQGDHARAILTGQITPLPVPYPDGPDGPDKLYLAVDGTGVPMRSTETAGRAGKGEDGRAGTREVKLAACFTQTKTTSDGHPIRDPDSTSYLATFDGVQAFTDLLDVAARQRGSEHIRQVIVLGDGARWIWNLANTRFPAATQIVDLFHAREHLHELANLLAFILGDRDAWLAQRLKELDNGDIEAISAAARTYDLSGPKAHELDVAVSYFETNAHRMRYAYYRSLGLFVGSGVVEAGCKSVIGARLKQSGMHWTVPGATGITTLRCQHASATVSAA